MKKLFLSALLLTAACASTFAQKQWWKHPYLTTDSLPNSVAYLPAPPDSSSLFFVTDWARYTEGLALRDTERGAQAKADADCSDVYMAKYYSSAMGIEMTDSLTPALFKLISRVASTSSRATDKAKKHYMRRRPFMVFNTATMTPEAEEALRKNGSYPSGHTAIGWGVALVLAEINPEAADSIFKLGYEYGQSRTIVGAHFQSDVDAGRVCASVAVSAMHADDDFIVDLNKAKREFASIKSGTQSTSSKPKWRKASRRQIIKQK